MLIDIAILMTLVYNSAVGIWRGAIRTWAGLTSLVLGLVAAVMFAPRLVFTVPAMGLSPLIRFVLIFMIIWMIVVLIGGILGHRFQASASRSLFSPGNLVGGSIGGFMKGVLILFPIVGFLALEMPASLSSSQVLKPVLPRIQQAAHWVISRPVWQRFMAFGYSQKQLNAAQRKLKSSGFDPVKLNRILEEGDSTQLKAFLRKKP